MNNKKILVMTTLLLAIILLGVGTISYFRRAVNGNITGQTGTLVFNVNGLNGETSETLIYSFNRSSDEPYVLPDDSGYFDLEITAEGSSTDVYVTLDILRDNLPDNLKFYVDEEHKVVINKKYFFFETTEEMNETLRIYWFWDGSVDDINDSEFINKSISARITLTAEPMEYGMMENGLLEVMNTGEFLGLYNLEYWTLVKKITFTNDFSGMPKECTEENLCFDISYEENQRYPVYAYLVETDELGTGYDFEGNGFNGNLYDMYIVSSKTVFAPSNSMYLFGLLVNLDDIDFNNYFNTSLVTDMSIMFSSCLSLNKLDLSSFDTSSVIDMNNMFSDCSSLTNLNLSSFDTSSVTDMNNMFRGCSSLTNLNLSSFDTSSVTDMNNIFYSCSNLTNLNLSSFDTSSVIDMNNMFSDCSSLTNLNLSSFDTSSVTDMNKMFRGCSSLTNLNLSSFDTSSVTDMNEMFSGCSNLTNLNLSSFDTSSVTNMSCMFYNCSNLTSLNLSSFDTSSVTNMSYMFYSCSSLTNLNLSTFDTSSVTDMGKMFSQCSSLTNLNLSSFDISGVTNMLNMFSGCLRLTTTITIQKSTEGFTACFENMFDGAATEEGAKITINYTSPTLSSYIDALIERIPAGSNVVKGSLVS